MFSKEIRFPPDFLWGTSTSAHQVDGGNTSNNWWEWELIEGKVKNGDKSGIACDHWDHYSEDFDILARLNQNVYRFSLEWSRIIPKKGKIDETAINHYHKFLAELKKRNIEAFVTIHHFTEPLWFTKYFISHMDRQRRQQRICTHDGWNLRQARQLWLG